MRAVVTRVSSASVAVAGETVGAIETGYLVLLGIAPADTQETARKLAEKRQRDAQKVLDADREIEDALAH